jgi:hypothetical protein
MGGPGGDAKFLLITCPPVDHKQRLEFQKERYGDKATGILERTLEDSGKYALASQEVATELDIPCLNLWDAFQTQSDWPRLLSDGLHLSPLGHDFVLQQLMDTIQREFPDLYVQPDPITGQACNSGSSCPGLSPFGPYHDHIQEANPEKAMKKSFAHQAEMELATQSSMDEAMGGNSSSSRGSPTNKKPKMDAPE